MTKQKLIDLKDILHWAKMQAKTDGMYIRINEMQKLVEIEIGMHEEVEKLERAQID